MSQDRSSPLEGTFHLHLPPAKGASADALTRAFYACARVRGIIRTVAYRLNVADAFDTIFPDTCMACLPRLGQLDDPKNVYSVIWRTAENFAYAARREVGRRDAAGVAVDADELNQAAAAGRHGDDARAHPDALAGASPVEMLEARSDGREIQDARAALRAKLEQAGFPEHISRDLEDNLRGRRATRSRRRTTKGSAEVVLGPAVLELREIRTRLALTINEMALRIGVPPSRMYSYLRGIVKSEEVMNTIVRSARELLPPDERKPAAGREEA